MFVCMLDFLNFRALSFNLSKDGFIYFKIFDVSESFVNRLLDSGQTYNQIISNFIESGEQIIDSETFSDFRLEVWNGKIWMSFSCKRSFLFENVHPILTEEIDNISIHLKKYSTLTKMEKKILYQLVNGKEEKEIPKVYNICLDTVKAHRKHIYRKLGFKRKLDLIK
jgi:DNA-binding CsgD family transcriptional regulator